MAEDKLDNIPPLGKSVEEVERTEGNRVNPSTPGERRQDEGVIVPIPVVNTGTTGGVTPGGEAAVWPGVVDMNEDEVNRRGRGDEPTDNEEA